MLFHSIHILANLASKETVPPQPRTSPHVTGILHLLRESLWSSDILKILTGGVHDLWIFVADPIRDCLKSSYLRQKFLISLCCDRKSRVASAQSFALWQQATMEFTYHDHSPRTLVVTFKR